ncbi:MAG: ferritin family protein [bacterium]
MEVYRCRICGEVYIGNRKPGSCPFCGAHQNYLVMANEWSMIKVASLSDVTKKNLQKALELEIDNTNFYNAVSQKTENIYVEGMFKGLSKVEREHASTICKHLRITKPESDVGFDKVVESDEENISEANRREKRAVRFYLEASNEVSESEIKKFFKALMEVESDHIRLTEQGL